ncbi:MAG: Flp pilus assembly protein CpaB [candidate division Zixibacteria bacterium]|nr:Flp pilus assembly protein CpaB [candidate division Zixibacteria bacterium]
MRKVAIVVVVVLALAFAGVASGLTYMYLRAESGQRGLEVEPVIVASKDLTFGESLESDDMKVAMFPRGSVAKGSYPVKDSLLGQVTKVFLKENEPILDSKLSSKGGGLSLLIEPNKRASSIEVDKVSGVSGFVLPGDRVDVILTVKRPGSTTDAVAKTILQNVEVLAAGEKTEEKGNKVITVQSVTLLVDPEGAQALALATSEGKLHLALRNPTDDEILAVDPVSKTGILKGKSKEKPKTKVIYRDRIREVVREPEMPDSLTVIKGTKKKKEAPAMTEKEG